MERLLLQNRVSVENSQEAISNSRDDIIQVLESVSLDSSLGFENQLLSLKYLVISYVWENKTREKIIKENKLMIEVEQLGETLMNADMDSDEKIWLMKKVINIVSVSEDAKNVAFRYRIWILGGLDK